MLLGAQPGACTAGELKASSLGDTDSYRCSCRERIRDCSFWKQIAQAMASRGYPDFDITRAGTNVFHVEGRLLRRVLAPIYRGGLFERIRDGALAVSPGWRRHFHACNARNKALIESLQEVTRASVVIDSSKNALRLKFLLKDPDLDLRVIRVLRDGRGVALTYMDGWTFADSSDPEMRGGGTGVEVDPVRRSMAVAADGWKRSNESCDALIATLPKDRWIEVRYEELCADPAATLRRLAAFLDLDPIRVILDFRAKAQHVIGNGMRMDSTSEIRLDERWRSHLNEDDLRTFDEIAGTLNRKYGYQ
jgi:hypothetical protein